MIFSHITLNCNRPFNRSENKPFAILRNGVAKNLIEIFMISERFFAALRMTDFSLQSVVSIAHYDKLNRTPV